MSKETEIDGKELEEVVGGFYGPEDWARITEEARKRGTCEKCGKKFEEAKHQKKPGAVYLMNINAQRWCEINWCGDCVHKYLGRPMPFIEK